jgi:homoserine O-acetyltransferase/O-succinyltransferase
MTAPVIITHNAVLELTEALPLDCGQALDGVRIAYETYGTLAADGGNVILICHATTGDQHVASTHPITGKEGARLARVCRLTPTGFS